MNIIGLDIGTTTISAIVLDSESGAVLEARNISNGADLSPRMDGERIQDPEIIVDKAINLVNALKEKYDIRAIGLDGQMHGIVYINEEGRSVSPLFTWQDQRGELPFQNGTYAGILSQITGYHVATGYGMATHYWHVVNHCVPAQAVSLCTIYDYVGMRLTGRNAPLMHISTAASLGLVDSEGWDLEALKKAKIDTALLPETTIHSAIIGNDPDGIPVACGIGDNQASFLGAMRDMSGGVLVNMGTGGQISMLATGQKATEDLEIRPLGDGKAIVVGSVLCGGRGYALLERFMRSCVALSGDAEQSLYESMNKIGLEYLENTAPLAVDTRFNGTRSQPGLRGAVTGIGIDNFDAGHLVAGMLNGMAREIHDLYALMCYHNAKPAAQLIGSGNGIRRNPALRRAFELAFDMPMQIPAHQEEAAFGAALFTMAASGLVESVSKAQALIQYI